MNNFSLGLILCLFGFLIYVLALIYENFTDTKVSFFVMIAKRLYRYAKKINLVKRLRYFFQQHDGLWSVPLSFFAFWLVGLILQATGAGVGTYDLGFIQPLLLAICVVVGATNAAVAGLWFTFRGIYRHLFGEKEPYTGKIVNGSKWDFKTLPQLPRLLLCLGMFLYFATMIIIVYLKFV